MLQDQRRPLVPVLALVARLPIGCGVAYFCRERYRGGAYGAFAGAGNPEAVIRPPCSRLTTLASPSMLWSWLEL